MIVSHSQLFSCAAKLNLSLIGNLHSQRPLLPLVQPNSHGATGFGSPCSGPEHFPAVFGLKLEGQQDGEPFVIIGLYETTSPLNEPSHSQLFLCDAKSNFNFIGALHSHRPLLPLVSPESHGEYCGTTASAATRQAHKTLRKTAAPMRGYSRRITVDSGRCQPRKMWSLQRTPA